MPERVLEASAHLLEVAGLRLPDGLLHDLIPGHVAGVGGVLLPLPLLRAAAFRPELRPVLVQPLAPCFLPLSRQSLQGLQVPIRRELKGLRELS